MKIKSSKEQRFRPLKRHPALVPLSQDHHFGLLLCWKIRTGLERSVEPERIARYVVYFFNEHLSAHFQEEEAYVFSLLHPEDEMRQEAIRQHVRLNKLKEKLQDDAEDLLTTLRQIEQELTAHIRFEERELFAYMQQSLSEEQLSRLQEKIENIHHRVEDHWSDPFWNKQ